MMHANGCDQSESSTIDRSPDRVRKLTLRIDFDCDASNPIEDGGPNGFEFHSFNTRHGPYRHPDEVDTDGAAYVWVLDYAEHGRCEWSLSVEGYRCPWDSCSGAGVLIYRGDKSDLPNPERTARAIVAEYTAWCNGDCYGFRLIDEDGEEVDSRWGFIGSEWAAEGIREHVDCTDAEWDAIEFEGDGAHLFD